MNDHSYFDSKLSKKTKLKLVQKQVDALPIFKLGPIQQLINQSFAQTSHSVPVENVSLDCANSNNELELPNSCFNAYSMSVDDMDYFQSTSPTRFPVNTESPNSNFINPFLSAEDNNQFDYLQSVSAGNPEEDQTFDSDNSEPIDFEFLKSDPVNDLFNSDDVDEITNSKINNFINGLFEIIVSNLDVKYSIFNQFLNLVQTSLDVPVPLSYKTLINRVLKNENKWDYYIRCECKKNFSFSKKDVSRIQCPFCSKLIDFKSHIKKSQATCSFSMKEQIIKISEICNDLHGLPASKDEEFNLTCAFSLDGVPLSKGTDASLYPVNIYITNIKDNNIKNKLVVHKTLTIFKKDPKLDLEKRVQKDHEIDHELCLTPLIEEIKDLTYFKTKWSNKTKIKFKCFLADAPCRHGVLEFLSHNGNYFCFRCLAELRKQKNKSAFLLLKSDDSFVLRTKLLMNESLDVLKHQKISHLSAGRSTSTEPTHFQGFKAETCLFQIPYFDPFKDTIVEGMHCFFLGITKKFLNHFYEVPNTPYYLAPNKNAYLDKKVQANRRLFALNVPSSVPRSVRSLHYWNRYSATELRYFLFFYSYFVLKDVLPPIYFTNFMILASSIFKIYSRRCIASDVDDSIREIDRFLESLEDKDLNYKKELITYNTHILVHAPSDRIKHGPLADFTADGYEGELKSYKQGFNSPNIRVETISLKTLLKIKINLIELDKKSGAKFMLSNLIKKGQIDSRYLSFINSTLNLVSASGIAFYKEVKNNFYNFCSAIYSNKINDAFIRVENDFFVILMIAKLSDKSYVLCKRIKTLGHAEIKFKEFLFNMKQIKLVDNQFSIENDLLRSPLSFNDQEYAIFDLKYVKCHAMYVELEEREDSLTNNLVLKKYIVDIEH